MVALKKVTYSLPVATVDSADRVAQRYTGGNISLVVDAALQHYVQLDPTELKRTLLRARVERQVTDRSSWILAFRQWLAGCFGFEHIESKYAPQYGGYMVVFMLKSSTEYPAENDRFDIHATPMQMVGSEPRAKDFPFARESSPIAAAEAVAEYIKSHPVSN